MDCKIVWTDPALRDLEEIVRFIAAESPKTAIRVGYEIVGHVDVLRTFPEIGPIYRRRVSGHVRQIICRPFRIFYRLQPSDRLVEILHVWHGARREPEALA